MESRGKESLESARWDPPSVAEKNSRSGASLSGYKERLMLLVAVLMK